MPYLPTGAAPGNATESRSLFESFVYITQMQQARCYEAAISYWRRLRSQPSGLTMGVLYWQLNDIAAYASWSGYDHGGAGAPLVHIYIMLYMQTLYDVIYDVLHMYMCVLVVGQFVFWGAH
jgi:beta-galactosidase/beta-glucuronidase